jgi:hypothetical protein
VIERRRILAGGAASVLMGCATVESRRKSPRFGLADITVMK